MHEEVLSTLDNRTKEFVVGLVIASFNDHLSHFSDLEKSIVGQPIIPSPSKTMPLGRATSFFFSFLNARRSSLHP